MGGHQGEKIMRRKSKREDEEQTVEVCLGGKGGACEKERKKADKLDLESSQSAFRSKKA